MAHGQNRFVQLDGPATYEIVVQGSLDPSWSDRLGGMKIAASPGSQTPTVKLTGLLADQAALHGVLTILHSLSLPIVSLKTIDPPA